MTSVALALWLAVLGGGSLPAGSLPRWAVVSPPALLAASLRPVEQRSPSAPTCGADQCPGPTSLPGSRPSGDTTGRRTELALILIERLDAGAVSSLARSVAATGLRIDYRPPTIEVPGEGRTGGYGRVKVVLRGRLDSFGAPSLGSAGSR